MAQIEPELQELPSGDLKVGAEHFRRVVRRIEYIKPVQKKQKPVITVTPLPAGGGHLIDLKGTWKDITVCEDGEPKVYRILVDPQT